MAGSPDPIGEVSSEFASVALRINHDGNGPRLEIEDLRTGHVGYLDALELETLAWLPEGALHGLLDPSHTRWRSGGC
ncbi:MAG TPA: hypothetical protein VGL92_06410 [Acidimicrobiia bacterium]|jgi:hypothetical protein